MMNRLKLIRITTISGSLNTLLKGQLQFLNQYFDVVGIASDEECLLKQVEQREGIKTINVPMRRNISVINDIISLWQLIKIFNKEKPYIVHANTPKGSLLGMVAAKIARVPIRIYTVTGLRFETTHGVFRLILKTMERLTCFCATKIIPEGDGVKNTLIRENITQKPLCKILNGNINGVDLDFYNITAELKSKVSKIKEHDNRFTFIFVGRIVRDKGINELISAFDRLNEQLSNIKLLLVGSFEDKLDPVLPETKQKIKNNPNIIFCGYQNDIRTYLAASDVLVLPSYREGFPNVVLQGGAMALPCIVSDINGCNEIIIEGLNGLIVPSQDEKALYASMLKLATDNDLLMEMSLSARNLIASRFRQEDVWQATLSMYQKTIKQVFNK